MRCLDRDPERRPVSALVVAAGLPGADPLAAALAAGETPSPELLAAAAESSAISVRLGLILSALTIAALLAFAILSARTSITGRVPLDLPPAVLVDRAEHVVEDFGYPSEAGDSAFGFVRSNDYTRWQNDRSNSPRRYDPVATGRPSAVLFWYRTSPRPLVPNGDPLVSTTDPPMTLSDMRTVVLDGKGRLQEFRSVPAQVDETAAAATTSRWPAAFSAAGLDMAMFTAVTPSRVPRDYADERLAWEGPLPEAGVNVRVEAASYRGRPTYFAIIGPWTPQVQERRGRGNLIERVLVGVFSAFIILVAISAALLARRNVTAGRADMRGAARLAAFMAALGVLGWIMQAHHTASIGDEFDGLLNRSATFALYAALLWINYIALEPYIRRLWPDTLLGWSRLLAGHVRDSRVGRDLLTGLAAGSILALLQVARTMVIPALGYAAPSPPYGNGVEMLAGSGQVVGEWLKQAVDAVGFASLFVLIVVLLRLVLRSKWLAGPASVLVFAVIFANEVGTTNTALIIVFPLAGGVILNWVLTRHGLLSLVVAWFALAILRTVPMMRDPSHWSAAAGNWTIGALAVLTMFAFYAARTGQPLFGKVLHDGRRSQI
jgi:serine/threonine-protein kinase